MRPPTYEWILDNPAFDRLLDWLDRDPQTAARKYEEIRRNLLKFFERRGCMTPEEQVDRVIDRVARKLTEGVEIYAVDPYHYFVGVARHVFQEYLRQRKRRPSLSITLSAGDAAGAHRRLTCMERCWSTVPPQTREMMIGYCAVSTAEKKRQREALAARFGLTLSNLRIRVHRVRQHLQRSIAVCLSTHE